MKDQEETPFRKARDDEFFHEIASPLIALRNGKEERVEGTLTVIGRGIGLTAQHVLAELLHRYDDVDDAGLDGTELSITFQLLGLVRRNGGKDAFPLHIRRCWSFGPTDLAIVELIPDSAADLTIPWSIPMMSLLPPRVGTRVAAFGFPNCSITRDSDQSRPMFNWSPTVSTGIVEWIDHSMRDKVMLPFPCYRTNARFDGGMSGGPVFDERGCLCGIICSSYPHINGDDAHISYVSTLWPIVGARIPIGPNGSFHTIYELFTAGVMRAIDLQSVNFRIDEKGNYRSKAEYSEALWEERIPPRWA
jgi:hypothetical protein